MVSSSLQLRAGATGAPLIDQVSLCALEGLYGVRLEVCLLISFVHLQFGRGT